MPMTRIKEMSFVDYTSLMQTAVSFLTQTSYIFNRQWLLNLLNCSIESIIKNKKQWKYKHTIEIPHMFVHVCDTAYIM